MLSGFSQGFVRQSNGVLLSTGLASRAGRGCAVGLGNADDRALAVYCAVTRAMGFLHQAGAAAILITLTLAVQSVGMAALINWGITHLRDTYRLGLLRSATLMVRFTGVMIVLHVLQILLWAGFYRWNCFPSWASDFYCST